MLAVVSYSIVDVLLLANYKSMPLKIVCMAPIDGEFLPLRVSAVDDMIERKGVERGSTVMLVGSVGCGKSTFCMQSAYHSALAGEKVVYISFEEPVERVIRHMNKNFGWDIEKLNDGKRLACINIDPLDLALSVTNVFARKGKTDAIDIKLPFKPDRIILDSLNALSNAFLSSQDNYRLYITYLLKALERHGALVIAVSENRVETYERHVAGIEEFVADGVIRLYTFRRGDMRQNALEIVKLRSSDHSRKIVPYRITSRGIEIFQKEQVFV